MSCTSLRDLIKDTRSWKIKKKGITQDPGGLEHTTPMLQPLPSLRSTSLGLIILTTSAKFQRRDKAKLQEEVKYLTQSAGESILN